LLINRNIFVEGHPKKLPVSLNLVKQLLTDWLTKTDHNSSFWLTKTAVQIWWKQNTPKYG